MRVAGLLINTVPSCTLMLSRVGQVDTSRRYLGLGFRKSPDACPPRKIVDSNSGYGECNAVLSPRPAIKPPRPPNTPNILHNGEYLILGVVEGFRKTGLRGLGCGFFGLRAFWFRASVPSRLRVQMVFGFRA